MQWRKRNIFQRGQSHISQFFLAWNCFFPVENFHFGTPQTNFSGFKKKKREKGRSSAHFHTFPPLIWSFPSSPFTISFLFYSTFLFSLPKLPLYPFLLFFPLPSFFSSFPLPSKISPNFPRVGNSPTSPTPSSTTANHTCWLCRRRSKFTHSGLKCAYCVGFVGKRCAQIQKKGSKRHLECIVEMPYGITFTYIYI